MTDKNQTQQGAEKRPVLPRRMPPSFKGAAARGGGANGKKPTISLPSLKFMED